MAPFINGQNQRRRGAAAANVNSRPSQMPARPTGVSGRPPRRMPTPYRTRIPNQTPYGAELTVVTPQGVDFMVEEQGPPTVPAQYANAGGFFGGVPGPPLAPQNAVPPQMAPQTPQPMNAFPRAPGGPVAVPQPQINVGGGNQAPFMGAENIRNQIQQMGYRDLLDVYRAQGIARGQIDPMASTRYAQNVMNQGPGGIVMNDPNAAPAPPAAPPPPEQVDPFAVDPGLEMRARELREEMPSLSRFYEADSGEGLFDPQGTEEQQDRLRDEQLSAMARTNLRSPDERGRSIAELRNRRRLAERARTAERREAARWRNLSPQQRAMEIQQQIASFNEMVQQQQQSQAQREFEQNMALAAVGAMGRMGEGALPEQFGALNDVMQRGMAGGMPMAPQIPTALLPSQQQALLRGDQPQPFQSPAALPGVRVDQMTPAQMQEDTRQRLVAANRAALMRAQQAKTPAQRRREAAKYNFGL